MNAAAYQQLTVTGGAVLLQARALLRLTGADSLRYLNGQISNDLRKLTPGNSLYACVMSAKGKLCGDVRIFCDGDAWILDADPALRESLPARLERYIISDDVTVEDISDACRIIHLLGGQPEGTDFGVSLTANSDRFGYEGRDLVVPASDDAIFEKASAGRVRLLESDCDILRIEKGVPRWGCELDENTIPQEAGLDRTAVDFFKGCYIGQEVVSRIKSVGHVNRILKGFALRSSTPGDPPAAFSSGANLFLPGNPEGAAGKLTSTGYSFALSRNIALGYLKHGVSAHGLIARGGETPECEVEVCEIPFVP